MLTLHYAPGACSLASHIALEETGAKYHAARLNMKDGEQRKAEYLAINPKGRVPALITDRGILTETPAILAWIAQSFPAAKLAPIDDPFEFARAQSFNSYLCSTVHVAHAHKGRGTRWADDPAALENMKKKVPENVAACFELIAKEMFKGPWVMGEAYSICDAYLFTVANWMDGDGVDPARFPAILAHRKRMNERPAVKRVLEQELAPAA